MRVIALLALVLAGCNSGTVSVSRMTDAGGNDRTGAGRDRIEAPGSDAIAATDLRTRMDLVVATEDRIAPLDAAPPAPDLGPDPRCDDPRGARFGMNIDPQNPAGNPSADELRAAGVRWVRMEWKAGAGFALYDGVIGALRSRGLKVLLLVDYSSVPGAPSSDADDAAWSNYRKQFAAGVAELATHYGDGVDAWQIWNEPDLLHPGEPYDPGVPALHFGPMLNEAVAAIRPSSGRPVITAGLASGDPGYLAQAIEAAGGTITVDAISVHPYGQRAPDDWPDPSWGFGNMSDLFARYLAFGLPLWVSEIGTDDLAHQGEYVGNVYSLVESSHADDVRVVFWFCWSDAMVPPYGILDAAGQQKPAYPGYAQSAPAWDPACETP